MYTIYLASTMARFAVPGPAAFSKLVSLHASSETIAVKWYSSATI